MKIRIFSLTFYALLMSICLAACGGQDQQPGEQVGEPSAEPGNGSLMIVANGEDFVRDGFISKDGWHIAFRHLYVTVSEFRAYQTDPPYDPHSGGEITGEMEVALEGVHTVDLVPGEGESETPAVGILEQVPEGHFNAMSWTLTPSAEGPSAGYSVYIDAQAEKGDQSYNVLLGFEDIYHYSAGEYVGDVRKGFVSPGETGELEMTFHFDHIFGDAEQPSDCELNEMAIGFEPFAALMGEGTVEEDLASLETKLQPEVYAMLLEVLPTLGHTGEGHCSCVVR